jgi:hypothetical protein
MSELITWQGDQVDVQARLIPRFLWTTASIDVFLNGECILRTGGQMKITGSHSVSFTHAGSEHTVELSWGVGWLLSFPYQLRIDGSLVSDSRVSVRNWPLGLLLVILSAAALVVILNFARDLFLTDRRIQ